MLMLCLDWTSLAKHGSNKRHLWLSTLEILPSNTNHQGSISKLSKYYNNDNNNNNTWREWKGWERPRVSTTQNNPQKAMFTPPNYLKPLGSHLYLFSKPHVIKFLTPYLILLKLIKMTKKKLCACSFTFEVFTLNLWNFLNKSLTNFRSKRIHCIA